ncbi:hypothetical protein RJT34_30992 [Clitoria ternatea]|uniref:Uncharacterized protein n=1 Tax=Clitoria ternatea TaxID=43366 RepID=A0AAN9F1A9_CLITE
MKIKTFVILNKKSNHPTTFRGQKKRLHGKHPMERNFYEPANEPYPIFPLPKARSTFVSSITGSTFVSFVSAIVRSTFVRSLQTTVGIFGSKGYTEKTDVFPLIVANAGNSN